MVRAAPPVQLKAQSVMLSRAVQSPSSKNAFYSFVMNYSVRLLRSCGELVAFCAKVDAWPNTGAITEPALIAKKQAVVQCLERTLGPLLLSLLVYLSNMPLQLTQVADMLSALRSVGPPPCPPRSS